MRVLCALILAGACAVAAPVAAQTRPPISQAVAGLQRQDGFVPIYVDENRGRLLLEIVAPGEDVLYFVSVAQGIGSVELGIDRGGEGAERVVAFERRGGRVFVVERNLKYRSLRGGPSLAQGVDESFASSVLAVLPIEAEENGRLLVDATPLIVRDAFDLQGALRREKQGTYRLDPNRSAINPARTHASTQSSEVEVTLTFATDDPGPLVSKVTPDPMALSIRVHHSLVRPPGGYTPRAADPRIGIGALTFKDYSAPYSQGTAVNWIRRWRLEKRHPGSAPSEPKQPIVFYLDPGIPEPIRTAMREGTLWWNDAFRTAGFLNAIQVKDPPEGMDPMDSRYSYILWVNRDERGFSVGGSFSDPRTGEILVAKPRMDSHRIRTIGTYWRTYSSPGDGRDDGCGGFLLPYEALLAEAEAQAAAGAETQEAVVRLRQALLTAHEVGHTLGFGHNWTSSINNRASVMEYPSPRVKLTGGRIDLTDAYQRGIGEYDKYMVRYAYTEFAQADERNGLEAIIREMREKGILYSPSADPRWNRYDDLSSPAMYLRETMAQRQVLLDRYGPDVLRAGEPYGDLRGMGLWMTYLHHRWAIDAGVRYIGGLYDNIVVKGDTAPPTEIVPAALQREVLALLMDAIQPGALAIPERLLAQLAPVPDDRDPEEFNVATGEAFDHLSAARTASALVLEQVLRPERGARLVTFADRQADPLTLPDVLKAVTQATWTSSDRGDTPMTRSLRRVAEREALDAMMILAADPDVTPEVRAITLQHLIGLQSAIAGRHDADPAAEAHLRQAERDLTRYLQNPTAYAPKPYAPRQPAGAPIGLRP